MPNDQSLAEYGYDNASDLADQIERPRLRGRKQWEEDDEDLDLNELEEDEFLDSL